MYGQLEERARGRLGTVLRGKYRLDSVLGVGGMAIVYRATHRNQAEYAIKMLHAELSLNDDVRARFLREGYAANSVKHPGVVRVVDDDVSEDGAAFLVMELLDGIPCDALGERHGGRLPLDAACAIAVELLDVLAAAHGKGIIHRDIKPANLFVTRDGAVKVLDFGIARVRDTLASGANATGTGMVLGTPVFMAPEQALGKASDIDLRADIWSVGATIFALASGGTVHDAETAPQLLVKLATQPARSLAEVVPGAPSPIVGIVDCALAFDREKRWPTAGAMRDAIASAWPSVFGRILPRTTLASLVGPTHETAGHALHAGSGARPPDVSAHPPVAAFGTPAAIGALPTMPARPGADAGVVETSSPVSRRVGTSGTTTGRRRAARGVMAAVLGLTALGCVAVVAFVLRAKRADTQTTATALTSVVSAESHSASSTTIATVDSPRSGPDGAAQPIVTNPVAQPAASVSANTTHALTPPSPYPKIAPAARPPPTLGPAHPSSVAPETRPPPAPTQPAPPAPVAPKPNIDPLDGRR